ncbi:MAG: PD-(D/E)XK nuclease family protein [Halobacteriovoraceae bacterium]|nr:PD-(D/E)XK nuclease family protein [Halobacteriovoraceae bacterium]
MQNETNSHGVFLTAEESKLFIDFLSKLDGKVFKKSLNKKNILQAIHKFSSLKEWDSSGLKKNGNHLYELAEENLISSKMQEVIKEIDHKIRPATQDYFQFLSKQLDENFYSDFIAAIINFDFSNKFGQRILGKLINLCNCNIKKTIDGKAYREVPLERFRVEENASMRIDILVSLKELGFLIIENKTKSKEHNAQTKYYYEAVNALFPKEKIHCIFLTINGEMAAHEAFVSCSYLELYKIMALEFIKMPFLEHEIEFIAPFFRELRRSFIETNLEAIQKAKQYRTQNETHLILNKFLQGVRRQKKI